MTAAAANMSNIGSGGGNRSVGVESTFIKSANLANFHSLAKIELVCLAGAAARTISGGYIVSICKLSRRRQLIVRSIAPKTDLPAGHSRGGQQVERRARLDEAKANSADSSIKQIDFVRRRHDQHAINWRLTSVRRRSDLATQRDEQRTARRWSR